MEKINKITPTLVSDLLTLRERCVAGYGLIEALDRLDIDDATREAAVRALYRSVPLFWRWLAGPISNDCGMIEDGLARYAAYPCRDDPAARKATRRVVIRLIDAATARLEKDQPCSLLTTK